MELPIHAMEIIFLTFPGIFKDVVYKIYIKQQ